MEWHRRFPLTIRSGFSVGSRYHVLTLGRVNSGDPTEHTIDNLLVVAANANRSSAACAVWSRGSHTLELIFKGCTYRSAWLNGLGSVIWPLDPCQLSSSAGITWSLHLAELVDWLLDECRLGKTGTATFERLSILHLTGNFIFPKAILSNLARLTSTTCMRFPESAKIKLLCTCARTGTTFVRTWEKRWEWGWSKVPNALNLSVMLPIYCQYIECIRIPSHIPTGVHSWYFWG